MCPIPYQDYLEKQETIKWEGCVKGGEPFKNETGLLVSDHKI